MHKYFIIPSLLKYYCRCQHSQSCYRSRF